MEFSVTEQQVPMLMRLIVLLQALQQKELKPEPSPIAEENQSIAENNGSILQINIFLLCSSWYL